MHQILQEENGRAPAASETITERSITLLGHVIRAENNDPMKKIAVDAEIKRVERVKRRVGRPRFYWLQVTKEAADRAMRKRRNLPKAQFDIYDKAKRLEIAMAAEQKEFPFNKKAKTRNWKKKNPPAYFVCAKKCTILSLG